MTANINWYFPYIFSFNPLNRGRKLARNGLNHSNSHNAYYVNGIHIIEIQAQATWPQSPSSPATSLPIFKRSILKSI